MFVLERGRLILELDWIGWQREVGIRRLGRRMFYFVGSETVGGGIGGDGGRALFWIN